MNVSVWREQGHVELLAYPVAQPHFVRRVIVDKPLFQEVVRQEHVILSTQFIKIIPS